MNGLKFRRQHPIGKYIADFYCDAHRLVIEIDGDTHAQQQDYDRERTQWLEGQGYRVIRFTNSEVSTNPTGVLQVILEACSRVGLPSPPPSPEGRGYKAPTNHDSLPQAER